MWTGAVMALSTTAVFGRADGGKTPVPSLRLKTDTCQIQARSDSTCSMPPSCDEVFFGMQPALSTWKAASIWGRSGGGGVASFRLAQNKCGLQVQTTSISYDADSDSLSNGRNTFHLICTGACAATKFSSD
jgi:hypothetical protein